VKYETVFSNETHIVSMYI